MSSQRNRKKQGQNKPIRKIHPVMRHKLAALFAIVLLAFVGLAGRVTYINAKSGSMYKKQVMSQAQSKYESRVMPAKRGDIYDRNGNLLATSNKVYNVILDCKAVNSDEDYIEPTIRALTEILKIDEGEVRKRLTSESTKESQYQIIKKRLSMDDKKDFDDYTAGDVSTGLTKEQARERANVKGVWFEEDYLRIYPYNELACDTIGFTLARDVADVGLESYYNSILTGVDGRQYGYFNNNADVEQTIIAPTNGQSIETTLDIGAQQIVEKWVNAYNDVVGAKNVGVIVEDPHTGEILAMDGGDRYDLNNPRDLSKAYSEDEIKAMNDEQTVEALNALWRNYCVTDAFEPGSVVKPIVMASALEKGKISTSDNFTCDGFQIFGAAGDVMIRCAVYPDAHGDQSLADVIANSCNDGMMQIAGRMGSEQFIKAQSTFNFGTRTGIDLPNEGAGIIHNAQTMGETELASCSFGQGFTCTMIQEVNAIASVVNGGYYYQPHLVTAVKDSTGTLVRNYTPTLLKQTISENISKDTREYMRAVVDYGTGTRAKILGYSSGGKTGTAEKLPRGNGKYLVSYVCFAPVDDPAVVMYVVCDEPNVEDQASSIYPQYIAQAILSELLPYLEVYPDESYNGYAEDTDLWDGFNGHVVESVSGEVDDMGYLVNSDGKRIDWDGNRIDENGYLLNEDGSHVLGEDGEYKKSTNLEGIDGSAMPEAISDTSVPEPLRDTYNPIIGNTIESEGITNEEAGLD